MKPMRRLNVLRIFQLYMPALFLLLSFSVAGQQKYRSEDLLMQVKGTGSAGPWEIKSGRGELETTLGLTASKVTGLYSLWFTVECESLQSPEASTTKNAQKALKSSGSEAINFVLSSAKVKEVSSGVYEMTCLGFLTIAGIERETDLKVTCKANDDGSFTCSGIKQLKMSDFDIKLPPAVMNNLKPADSIEIVYNLKINRKL
jgi:hypothetical protein